MQLPKVTVICHFSCCASLSKQKTRAATETAPLPSCLCWKTHSVLCFVTEHWPGKGLFPSLWLLLFAWKWAEGRTRVRRHIPSGRRGHSFLATIKRFKQGLLLKYGSIPRGMFLLGSVPTYSSAPSWADLKQGSCDLERRQVLVSGKQMNGEDHLRTRVGSIGNWKG